jgi:hypothetical protein
MRGGEATAVKVAIAQVDGKWPNLALAKIAGWHSVQGHAVAWFNAMMSYDVVYASKVFSDSPDNDYLPADVICGGSGYSLASSLQEDIERCKPYWPMWPLWHDDLGYSTRGCPNRCPFCIVPDKEGDLRVVAEFGDLTTGRRRLILHDNNATAAPLEHFRKLCDDATAAGVELDFRQGLDARLLSDEHAAILARSKLARRIHFAFDSVADEEHVRQAIALCDGAGIIRSRLTFYVLVGYDSSPEDDLERIEILRSLRVDPFVMPYDRNDHRQRRLARWVNNKVAFHAMTWPEFQVARV